MYISIYVMKIGEAGGLASDLNLANGELQCCFTDTRYQMNGQDDVEVHNLVSAVLHSKDWKYMLHCDNLQLCLDVNYSM